MAQHVFDVFYPLYLQMWGLRPKQPPAASTSAAAAAVLYCPSMDLDTDHSAVNSRFRLFTKESLVRIERRVQEEQEAKEAKEKEEKEKEKETHEK